MAYKNAPILLPGSHSVQTFVSNFTATGSGIFMLCFYYFVFQFLVNVTYSNDLETLSLHLSPLRLTYFIFTNGFKLVSASEAVR